MQAALANSALLDGKLAGLNNATYAEAFHLRPGLEIVSATADGDLVVRATWTCRAIATPVSTRGRRKPRYTVSGEAGSLAIRAGGDLEHLRAASPTASPRRRKPTTIRAGCC
ncbi:hypothetical protein P4123_29330 [Pseudomonas aeruginosa]|nr:hypothetical protein [Pseudomonas aeruginosa]